MLVMLLAAMVLAPVAHATTGSLTDTTVADFSSGGPSTDTYVAETEDGELMLAPTAGVEFYGSAMPAGWSSTPMESGGTALVQDGVLQADGARVFADLAHEPGRSLEFVATFGAAPSQSAGFGDITGPGARWTMFTTLATSTDLFASTNVGLGVSVETLIPGSFLGAPHTYRIEWNLASVDFFVDGAPVATHSASPAASMPPFASDEQLDEQSIALDWLRIGPYPGTGSFESRVLDAGRRVDWEALSWTIGHPAGTAVFLSARTGDTPTPDGTWTSFAPVALSGDPVGASSRYIQYRVDLMSSDPARSPILDDVSISYTDATAPTVTIDDVSDALLGPLDTGTDVTWHADEDGAFSVRVGGEDCATGDAVESGSYSGAPAQHITTVSAGQLAEGANTVRVCVSDAVGNEGAQTTSVVKDTTAPTVVVDSVSDTLIGSADTGTDVTWRADEDGAYTVRVGVAGWPISGAMGCMTDTTVASGSYTGAPEPSAASVSAGDLRETLNPIRVCLVDAAGNLGSETVWVVKDLTAPAVVVDSVSATLIGPSDTGTDVTWHANDTGPYSIRVGGTSCTTGTEVASGVYTVALAQHTTTVSAGDLSEGANTIRVCVADVWGNNGTTTTSVVKDATAPGVAIDGVSDDLVGPADTGTTVTWNADESGTYSVRVGGTSCATGTEVGDGNYTAPAQHITTVSAGDLSEGANTIRVCVTDAAGNDGSETTSVVKDTTAPTVTVDSVSDTLIGPSDTGTDITWHAGEDGPYNVRVGGAGCTSGNEVDNGSYSGAPAQHITTVSAGDLSEGANTIRVCVIDAAGNSGSETTSVVKDLNPPIVAIDAVSDSLLGPAAPASDITWQASESGTYSVRAGGAGCTTGNVISGGSYGGPPEQTTTTVTVADLSEGANTIRVCVTDAGGSHGSQTTSVVKDTTAPTVAIDAVSDTLIGPDDPSTDVTWHAGEDGTYGVRVGGGGCTTGTEVETAGYTGAPAQHITTVSAGDLSEGENTIRVCVTDAAGNQDSQTTTVAKDTAERVTLTFGPQADARVEEANPDSNFGTSSSLRVEGGSALDIESYLRFQVAGVLGTVEQATLRLWVSNGTANGPAAYKTDWAGAETAITWNNRAPRTSGPSDDKGNVPANAFVEYDVTPLVTGNGANGFVLAGTSSDAMTVSSKEASTVSQRPQLIVTAVVEGVDAEPPTAPTGLTASAAWPTEVDLNWTEAIDNVGVTAYEIYRDGALLTTVGDVTHYADMTALASTSYDYTVRALDAEGNRSDASNEAEVATPAPTADPVIMAAGDQACDPTASAFNGGLGTSTACRQKYTSDLLVNRDLEAVLALGDIQYECGGYNAFLQSYDPTWGRVKSITYPVPGNHEYHSEGGMDCDPTGNALGYFNYFGAAAGDPAKGYYSFDVGAWHLIALNSNCAKVSCATSSAQVSWLRQDLAANPRTCTLAFWHHPRFTSGTNAPGSTLVKPLYQALYDYNADVVLVGHDHDYERFALQDPEGALDPVRGIRQFVVGTGGKSFHNFSAIQPGSEARNNDSFGVLKLVLSPTSYEWRFIPEAGKTYTDTGSTPCAA